MTHTVVVYGMPRTKKTSNVVTTVKGRPIVLPAAEWRAWTKEARILIDGLSFVAVRKSIPRLVPLVGEPRLWTPLTAAYNCRALFYLTARQHGDALGYYQGLADLLEARRVIENDRLLVSWDGSRLLRDRANPRVEVTLVPVPADLMDAFA